MKFARHLQDTHTPEWKKAYIDYHGLKVQLRAIRADAPQRINTWSSIRNTDRTCHSTLTDDGTYAEFDDVHSNGGKKSSRITNLWVSGIDPTTNTLRHTSHRKSTFSTRGRIGSMEIPSFSLALASLPRRVTGPASHEPPRTTSLLPKTHHSPSGFPLFKDPGSPTPLLLHTLRSNLPAVHAKFFDLLDAELDKVEAFYTEREKEMNERANQLRKQLDELGVHRQMFIESSTQSKVQSWVRKTYLSVPPAFSSLFQWFRGSKTNRRKLHQTGRNGTSERRRGRRGLVGTSNLGTRTPRHRHGSDLRNFGAARNTAETDASTGSSPTLVGFLGENGLPSLSFGRTKQLPEPHEYQNAKRRLRNAVVEHYRGLEALNNFRMLNLTGFRKALRKYGKITGVPVLDAYMKEKVEPSIFASGVMVSTMLKEMEHMFATRFEHGDKKRAMNQLRVGPSLKTHHFSTFRSGLWLGLALPAICAGSYQCFQEYTRKTLPSWNILLFIYSVPLIPILLALLVGINILVWVQQRVSYVFIFKLNPRSKLDPREYFELPSFLLCTLAYAYWFSLAQLGPPMLWPLIWHILIVVVLFNPFRNFLRGRARWWTIKKVAKLAISGMRHVEFADTWLGDEFCSLVYSLSNLYFVGCFFTHSFGNSASPNSALQRLLASAYDRRAQIVWSTCSEAQHWGWYYLLGTLPFIARFAQNIRRYWDSKLPSQLMNAGKYGMGMIQYLCYCYWRHRNSPHTGKSYILWCFASTVYTIYAYIWDVWMDWSMGRLRTDYPLLRAELIYNSYIPCYYFALISNLCLRFLWLAYVFVDEDHFTLCTFIVALLEMLRRVQWNFYRLEGKHLHNMGLNRITREMPLPYILDSYTYEEEIQLKKRMAHLS